MADHVHILGICGTFMGGLALLARDSGFRVSGSDANVYPPMSTQLIESGIAVTDGYDPAQLEPAPDCVVVGNALSRGNAAIERMLNQHLQYTSGPEWLGQHILKDRWVLAVAGTHGKTTTTSLVASVLAEAGLDPTFVIGGRLNSAGTNAKLGTGDYIVVEADESDASFLNLLPVMSVVTNIDADHMETYGHDFEKLKSAFVEFLHRMPFYGTAIVCSDDPGVQSIVDQLARPVTTYGLEEGAQIRAIEVRADHGKMHFTVQRRNGVVLPDLPIVLNLPGLHNVLNALAAVSVAVELGVDDAAVQRALAHFKGVGRRFQRYGEVKLLKQAGSFTLIDDYGHHPVEMAATLAAARGAFPGRRLVLAFQPHRYSRTRDCFEDFVSVISQGADTVLLSEVYAAGEAPIVAADGRSLSRALRVAGKIEPVFIDKIEAMAQAIFDNAKDGDIVICMGAGTIGAVPAQVQKMGGAA